MNWLDFLCDLLGCRTDCTKCENELAECQIAVKELTRELDTAGEKIRQLELLIPRPKPPEIDYIVEKDSFWIQQTIDSLGLGIIRLPLDGTYRLTNQTNFLNIVAWDWIDTVKYQAEKFDCENFAIAFKSQVDEIFLLNQVGIVIDYESGHAYNLVIFPNGKVFVFEPQMDNLVFWTNRIKDLYSLKGAIVLI